MPLRRAMYLCLYGGVSWKCHLAFGLPWGHCFLYIGSSLLWYAASPLWMLAVAEWAVSVAVYFVEMVHNTCWICCLPLTCCTLERWIHCTRSWRCWMNVRFGCTLPASSVQTGTSYLRYSPHTARDPTPVWIARWRGMKMTVIHVEQFFDC